MVWSAPWSYECTLSRVANYISPGEKTCAFLRAFNFSRAIVARRRTLNHEHGHSKYGLETQLKSLFYLFVRLYAILWTVNGH